MFISYRTGLDVFLDDRKIQVGLFATTSSHCTFCFSVEEMEFLFFIYIVSMLITGALLFFSMIKVRNKMNGLFASSFLTICCCCCFVLVFGFLVCFVPFKLINVTELEQDSLNPMDMCKETNRLYIPELAVTIVLFLMFLVNARWIEVILLTPFAVHQVRLFLLRQHVLDPTEIYEILPSFKKVCLIKLTFCVIFFFFLLYRFISGLISGY